MQVSLLLSRKVCVSSVAPAPEKLRMLNEPFKPKPSECYHSCHLEVI